MVRYSPGLRLSLCSADSGTVNPFLVGSPAHVLCSLGLFLFVGWLCRMERPQAKFLKLSAEGWSIPAWEGLAHALLDV